MNTTSKESITLNQYEEIFLKVKALASSIDNALSNMEGDSEELNDALTLSGMLKNELRAADELRK